MKQLQLHLLTHNDNLMITKTPSFWDSKYHFYECMSKIVPSMPDIFLPFMDSFYKSNFDRFNQRLYTKNSS